MLSLHSKQYKYEGNYQVGDDWPWEQTGKNEKWERQIKKHRLNRD